MGFQSLLGVDHALAVLDTVLSIAVEWNCDVWCASLDLKKAFDRIEFKPLFEALRCLGLPVTSTYCKHCTAQNLAQTQGETGRCYVARLYNMIECLVQELGKIGLRLTASKAESFLQPT